MNTDEIIQQARKKTGVRGYLGDVEYVFYEIMRLQAQEIFREIEKMSINTDVALPCEFDDIKERWCKE